MTGADIVVLRRLSGESPFPLALSIGCGAASKEISLLRSSVVGTFVVHEISNARIALGKQTARRLDVEKRIEFRNEAIDFSRPPNERFNLIYWNNSLHHMLDVRACLEWCRGALCPGGTIYLNDFVGPTRMQWPDEMLQLANVIRGCLPARILMAPDKGALLPALVKRPSLKKLMERDPTECADSAQILPALRSVFDEPVIQFTGGVVYHLAINGLLHNFNSNADYELLAALLASDQAIAGLGMTHYAVAHARI
jgi:SAM-dependent methyltransferase